MQIALIGLGNMGLPMALNLVRKGHSVHGFDLSERARSALQEAGGKAATSVLDAAQSADVVITMLPASRHVKSVYEGEHGLFKALPPQTLLIDCSTIAPAAARELAAAAAQHGLCMIDAPVSGGTQSAQAGSLTFMVGGPPGDLERARPVLQDIGQRIVHAGASGAGQTAKLCNNMLLGIIMIANSEAIQLGVANGLEAKALCDIIANSSGANWALSTNNPCPGVNPGAPSSRDYTGGFAVDLMLKDLGLAVDASTQSGTTTAMGGLARNIFAMQSSLGHGAKDFGSVFSLLGARPA